MKNISILILNILIIFLICSCIARASAETTEDVKEIDTPSPSIANIDHSWQFDRPENRGVNLDGLARFHAALDEHNIRAVVMVKDGYIIDEYYKPGTNENSVLRFASVTKSVSGAVMGIAIERGYISGVNARLSEFFPQLNEPGMERKRNITIEQLLTHTSGIYWNEWAGGDYIFRLNRAENWVDFIFSQNMQYEPGTRFNYTTGGSHLLGAIIQNATGKSAFEFAKENLFTPIGMNSVIWRSDPQGITDAGNGISMTARDAARFGQLFLDGGKYQGQQIISESWIQRSTRRQVTTGSPNSGNHGYQWWIRSFGRYEAFYAMGHGGQYIIIIPGLNLVVVMSGHVSNTYLPQNILRDHISIIFI